MVKVGFNGKLVLFIMEILKKVNLMGMVYMNGLMVVYIEDNGRIIKWMEKVNLFGLMEENI